MSNRNRHFSSAIAPVFLALLAIDLFRFAPPRGEKLLPAAGAGLFDFTPAYLGALHLVRGNNPYPHRETDPEHPRLTKVEAPTVAGTYVWLVYPIGHLLVLSPLALLFGENAAAAGKVWLAFNLILLLVLAWITRELIETNQERTQRDPAPWALLAAVFALSFGGLMALERGQSEILVATLCWASVLAATRRQRWLALGLSAAATLVKYYGLPLFAAYLFALPSANRKRDRIYILIGTVLVAQLLFIFGEGMWIALTYRLEHQEAIWVNLSFWNLITPSYERYRFLIPMPLTVLSALLTLGYAWHYRATRNSTALVAFAVVALATEIAALRQSYPYTLVYLYPGIAILYATRSELWERKGWNLLAALAVLALVFPLPLHPKISVAGWGIFCLLAFFAARQRQLLSADSKFQVSAPPSSGKRGVQRRAAGRQ